MQLQALFARYRGLILPVVILACIGVLLVPLPPFAMDILLAVNIALSLIILLTTIYVRTPTEFSVFPSLLVATTLARLVLNVGTTRLILTHAGDRLDLAAGSMIRAFGNFVAGEFVVVGVVVFAIIVLIQFLVITKGSSRISEVAARFALDGLPGKQMAIDAELNSGAIDDLEARRRREDLTFQADFYGSMDGASKFVRGDAVAGVCITLINIVGGLCIGIFQFKMPISEAVNVYTRLTIGDGLASQIPAFLISIAAALLVTRNAQTVDLSSELLKQLFSQPQTLAVAGVFLALLILTNLPTIPLLLLGSSCIGLSWLMNRNAKILRRQEALEAEQKAAQEKAKQAADPEQMLLVDPIRIEIGPELLRLADPQRGGDLMDRISSVRGKLAREMGFLLPKLRLKDNLQLGPTQYRLLIGGNMVAAGEALPGYRMLRNPRQLADLQGQNAIESVDPISRQKAAWIPADSLNELPLHPSNVCTPTQLIADHLEKVARTHADELLSREVTRQMVDQLRKVSPAIVDELIPDVLSLALIQQVLQQLLADDIPIGQLGLILETCGDCVGRTTNPILLTQFVRERLSRTICRRFSDRNGQLFVIQLDAGIEDRIATSCELTDTGIKLHMPSQESNILCRKLKQRYLAAAEDGRSPVLLVRPAVRLALRELIRVELPMLPVMSSAEIALGTKVVPLSESQPELAAV